MRGPLLATQNRIEHLIVPAAVTPLGRTDDAFFLEARLLQRASLGDVLHIGIGFDPLCTRVPEEIVRELTLRLSSDPASTMLLAKSDRDHPAR